MYKGIFFLLFIGSFLVSIAQPAGFIPLADFPKFKEQFATASQKTQSIRSDFVQEKNLSMLSEKIISKGRFWFKKDNLLRMEYIQPFAYLMIMNKNNVYVKDGSKENRVSTASNKLFKQINKITIDCVQGTVLDNGDFSSKVFENQKEYLVELIPTEKNLKIYFKTIRITVNKKDYSVIKIDMEELSGDNTLIHFINKELNVTIPDALFAIN
jgi:outer membrane lipoprotein-sorting protein